MWGCYDAYMCILDRVTITDNGGMGPYIQVYAVECTWASVTVPHHC
jgi:hypothetical protein